MINKFVLFFLILASFIITVPAYAAVVINEVYPKTSNITEEWVELYNTGSESVSLNLWKLDHTAGDAKSFIINASGIIEPRGFLTFGESQTGIDFSIDGDTVRLFDQNGMMVDSQSYPGILGYNTSMGRSIDGAGTWSLCTTATYNTNNNCPAPSPTATPMPTIPPTPIPTATPTYPERQIPTMQDTPTPTPTMLPTPTQAPRISPSPTPDTTTLNFTIHKSWIGYAMLAIAAGAVSLMVVLWLTRK